MNHNELKNNPRLDILNSLYENGISHCKRALFHLVQEYSEYVSIKTLCRCFSVSKSGYYKWHKRNQNPGPNQDSIRVIKTSENSLNMKAMAIGEYFVKSEPLNWDALFRRNVKCPLFIRHNNIIEIIKKEDKNVGLEGRKLKKYSKEFNLSAVEDVFEYQMGLRLRDSNLLLSESLSLFYC